MSHSEHDGAPESNDPDDPTGLETEMPDRLLGLGTTVGDPQTPDCPILPLDYDEPGHPAPSLAALAADADSMTTLQRLAGREPQHARAALLAALACEPYDPQALPETRAMVLGMARAMVAYGVTTSDLVNAIIDAMNE